MVLLLVILQAVLLDCIGFHRKLFLLMWVWMIVIIRVAFIMRITGIRIVIMRMIGIRVMRMIVSFMRMIFPIVRMRIGTSAGSQIKNTKRAYKNESFHFPEILIEKIADNRKAGAFQLEIKSGKCRRSAIVRGVKKWRVRK
jgi:hypothetical protein